MHSDQQIWQEWTPRFHLAPSLKLPQLLREMKGTRSSVFSMLQSEKRCFHLLYPGLSLNDA